ncbi:MAG: tRNA glutamyl-Q(34) synthetase GluQRS [Colwellia sp.]
MQNLHTFSGNKSCNKRPEKSNPISQYRGRFAPSPSGLLHFGSLIAALASFLDAKAFINDRGEQGKWLVRIEDIDPPREQQGASHAILTTLEAFGLHWDETELYQSTQLPYYRDILSNLSLKKLSYFCQCTRANIKATGGIYQGHCRTANIQAQGNATRLINQYGLYQFNDIFQGNVTCDKALAEEDFIIHRKDGLFAYQLAVVADDISQGISHVIRGCDLLEPTARQLTLYQTLNERFLKGNTPQFGHIPLAITSEGYKLSKQNKAAAIDNAMPQPTLIAALTFLGQSPVSELIDASVAEIMQWAITHWQRDKVPNTVEINID